MGELVALRDVGVEIILAVELGEVGEPPSERESDAKHMTDGFLVHHGERAGMSHADRADVHVRPHLVGVVLRITEHLRPRLQFSMDFEANGKHVIVAHSK